MTEKCTTGRYSPPWTETVIFCDRENGHLGKHQNISRSDTGPFPYREIRWAEDGSATTNPCLHSSYWNECDTCSILIDDEKTHCDVCIVWQRVFDMNYDKYIIVDGALYLENPEYFESSRDNITVLWFDETRPALISGSIYRFASIPDDYKDIFPDNAKFKPQEKRNGGLFVPYGISIPKEEAEKFLATYGRLN